MTASGAHRGSAGKQAIFFVAGLFLAALVAGLLFLHLERRHDLARTEEELQRAVLLVSNSLDRIRMDLRQSISTFARSTAADPLFALRLLAEHNPAAPEVTGRAAAFQGPMGFGLLEIIDSGGTILSSGSFPADAGNLITPEQKNLTEEPGFLEARVIAARHLTLQAMAPFTIADSIRFFALGGLIVDSAFLARLSPDPGIRVLLRRGDSVMGLPEVRTLPEVTGDRVTISGKTYPAARLPLLLSPATGGGPRSELIVLVNKPVKG